MAVDIGEIIFVGLLQMTQYPGSPFTGNLFRDLIMFLIVPTIFIILVIFMMVTRLLPIEYPRLRILLAVGAYLFIIASGFYPAFAYLAGPYFIFLIFIAGLLFFLLEHFHTREPQAAGGGGVHNYPAGIPRTIAHNKQAKEDYIIEQRMREIMRENPGGNYPEDMLYNMAKREIDYEKKHGRR